MNRNLFPLLICLSFLMGQQLGAQTQDNRTLFSINGNTVPVSEFTYIYAKTNQDKADFSEASLQEYLDLYTKFKLKVQKARDLQLDTVPALKSELEGYRRQLANSYLTDKEVTNKLAEEAYNRMLKDVEMSHIFFNCDVNAKPADTLAAYNKAMAALKEVKGGLDFGRAAVNFSEDKAAKETMGRLGFVTAMFPNGFYDMEVGIYKAKKGDVIGPFRSFSGYHVVKVGDTRPARGQMEVAHILLRKQKDGDPAEAKTRADEVYAKLRTGADWNQTVAASSDDKNTASKGGNLGSFGINQYQNSFEEAAFALENDGDISEPIETSIGYHIIKRVSRKPMASFEDQRRILAEKIKRDSRSEIAKKHMIQRIQTEGNFKEDKKALDAWAAKQVDTIFTTFRWKATVPADQTPLLMFGTERTFTIGDLENYCERAARERMRAAGTDMPLRTLIDEQYNAFVDDATMLFEESQLDKKYPDFKSLMREYEEGILLFDATKRLVWDKANVDTIGLQDFFNKEVRGRYKWEERAVVDNYSIKSTDAKVIASIQKLLKKKGSAAVLKKFNKKEEIVTVIEKKIERNKAKSELATDLWQAGAMSTLTTDQEAGVTSFKHTVKLLPEMAKELSECRGYAVADYQDFLDKQWVADLEKEYKVDLDKAVFKSLIRK